MELNGLEAPDDLQINTVTQQATQQNSAKPKPHCQHCKKPGHYRNQCRQLNRERDHARNNTSSADKSNNNNGKGQINSNSNNKASNNTNANNTNNQKKAEDLDLSIHFVRPLVELTTTQRNNTLEQMQRTHRLPGIDDRKDNTKRNREMLKATQTGMFKLQPKL